MIIENTDINKLTREKALKHLYELSLKTIGAVPQLVKPNEEQKEFIKRKHWRVNK